MNVSHCASTMYRTLHACTRRGPSYNTTNYNKSISGYRYKIYIINIIYTLLITCIIIVNTKRKSQVHNNKWVRDIMSYTRLRVPIYVQYNYIINTYNDILI